MARALGSLRRDAHATYTLTGNAAWIVVKGVTVRIAKTNDGIIVETWRRSRHLPERVASFALYDEEQE